MLRIYLQYLQYSLQWMRELIDTRNRDTMKYSQQAVRIGPIKLHFQMNLS